tara:strand:+ start:346 stop:588 length:243 start_codon:yes stop_codon:yes gene_type:complete
MSEVPEDRLQAQQDFEEDMRENQEFYKKYLTAHHDDYPDAVHWDYIVDKWVAYDHGVTEFFEKEEEAREWYQLNTHSTSS